MIEATIDRLRDRIGDSVTSVEGFTVEPGKVAEFAATIGDDDPVFREAAASGDGDSDNRERVPAPITFTRVSFFPHYRPPDAGRVGFDLGYDVRAELHGEQVYEFFRPVYVGDTLTATTTLTDAYERKGQADGTMTFAVLETDFVDESGAHVLTERSTLIEAPDAASADDLADAPPDRDSTAALDGAEIRQPNAEDYPVTSPNDVTVGDTGPTVIVDGLTPRDFVQYAGASGDFNPIHYDQEYAQALGNPSVFGQGMFTMGVAGHFVADWFGIETVRSFGTRFTARVWPGDTVTVDGKVTAVEDATVTAAVTATRQTGETVLSGEVTATFGHGTE